MMETGNIIFTLHPEGKKGACISKNDYRLVSSSILSVLQQQDKITLNELIDILQQRFNISVLNNLAWRILVVKLDLEAKGVIKTIPHKYNRNIVYLKLNRREWKRQLALAS